MAIQITGAQLKDAAITDIKVASNAITTVKINNGAITSAKLGANSVLTAAISDNQVTSSKLGANSVLTAAISDNQITTQKLAANSVTSAKLGANSVLTAAISNAQITSAKLASNSVLTAAISNAQVTKAKLAANSVDSTVMNMTATYDFSSGTVRVAGTPSNSNDATSKSYVDSISAGASFKDACLVATSADINLTSLPAQIDSQNLATDDRFLCRGQSPGSENGVYLFKGANNAAVRSSDLDAGSEFPGAAVFILKGSDADMGFICTNDTVNLGTTAITFTQFTGLGQITVSGGLSKTGNDLSISNAGVTTVKIADANITAQKLASNSVLTAAISDNQITNAKMANDSVGANEYIDASVGTVALANAAITSAKMGANSVLTAAISNAQVTSQKIADNAILTAKLSNASVTASKIGAGAVGTSALAATSVTEAKLGNSSVTAGKLGVLFKQEFSTIGNGTTTTIDLGVALAANMVNAVLVFKNGLNILNMTALGDTAAGNDEYNVSATGGSAGVCRLTFGSALENGSSILIWYIQ